MADIETAKAATKAPATGSGDQAQETMDLNTKREEAQIAENQKRLDAATKAANKPG